MAHNFTTRITFDGRTVFAAIVPALRRDGMHYEVNISGFPRFTMAWSALDRYDVIPREGQQLPDSLVLAVSDEIERRFGGGKR